MTDILSSPKPSVKKNNQGKIHKKKRAQYVTPFDYAHEEIQ